MFLDLRDQWPPVPPPTPLPETPPPRLRRRAERLIGWIVVINVGLLLAPAAGSTVIHALVAAFRTLAR